MVSSIAAALPAFSLGVPDMIRPDATASEPMPRPASAKAAASTGKLNPPGTSAGSSSPTLPISRPPERQTRGPNRSARAGTTSEPSIAAADIGSVSQTAIFAKPGRSNAANSAASIGFQLVSPPGSVRAARAGR